MIIQKQFDRILDHLEEVVKEQGPLGIALWHDFLKVHPADIAQFFSQIERFAVKQLFLKLPEQRKLAVFKELPTSLKVFCLSLVSDQDRSYLLGKLPIDELTDFFDELSDEELKKYLKLLHKKDREQVISLLRFNPDSAGGLMHTNVLTLMQDFTVERSIQIVQRLQPDRDLHQRIFVTDQNNELIGFIQLEDLVLKSPKTRIGSIMRPNELIVSVDQDGEEVARAMKHYSLLIVPVVDTNGVFLGVISSDTLIEIIEQEAEEDLYRMAALTPIENSYFETPFFKLVYQRSFILIALLFVQSFSTMIIKYYEATLEGFLLLFITMLTSTGGNASNQTSAFAIQGMAMGEINAANSARFIKRELMIAGIIAVLLGIFSFVRIYPFHGNLLGCCVVSFSLALIVLFSIMLGSCMPIVLKRLGMDPAHSAGPLLATLMDVFGLLIYCVISHLILK